MSLPILLLLGPPRIERDGQSIEVDTRKAIALIAYLVVTGQRHSRDALATLLWPDYDQTRARAALRRTLSVLNKALEGAQLDVDRESIGLDLSSLWVDLAEFRRLLAESRKHGHGESDVCTACVPLLTDAVKLYRDDFLAGFTLRDSPNFDDWQFFQAEGLRRELAGALERLVRVHTMQSEWEAAITYARRWLALDPLHEPAHRTLMSLFAWAGTRAAAFRQYRECVRLLDQELGVTPLEETTRLYEAIKENQIAPPPTAEPAVSVVQASEVTPVLAPLESHPTLLDQRPAGPSSMLVGRANEWATLLQAYSGAAAGRMVVLEGEPGIGKTRLAEEFLAYVRSSGALTIAARCYAGETHLVYGPFVEALSAAMRQPAYVRRLQAVPAHWLSEAARLLPDLHSLRPDLPPAPPLDTPGAQSRFFEGMSQVLLAICGGTPSGVLCFDDLHWADVASLDLLLYIVRRLRERPFCLLLTWRSEQGPADTRLRDLQTEAQRAGIASVLPLERLTESAVLELVQSAKVSVSANVGGDALPLEGLGQRLYHETEGLPLFLGEYLTAIERGMLIAEDTAWSLPGGVRDLLRGRLTDVSETGAQLLNTAAVIGRSFDFDTLREASGRSEDETVLALEELIGRGLVGEVRSSGDQSLLYDFNHEKLRTLVYEETSLARRRLLHRRIAQALVGRLRGRRDSGGAQPRPYSQIAYHFQLAGQESEAADYFKLAGEHARALYANAEAVAHFRTALALGHPDVAELHEAIGDLYTLLGEYSSAITSYESAAALRESVVLATVEHKLANVHQRRREWVLAEHHLQAALTALGADGATGERARIYADWSLVAHQQGQTEPAAERAQRALDLAEAAHDARALAEAHNRLGILASSQGDVITARHHLEHSLTLAEQLDDPNARAAALNNLALTYTMPDEHQQALQLAEAALALLAVQGDRHREAALHNNLSDLLHAAGESEAAMSHLKQAVAIYAEIGVEAGTLQPAIWQLAEW